MIDVTETPKRTINAKCPNHTWGVDLTTIPTGGGFWTPWFPFCLPRYWPFCWWILFVIDHYSRRVMGFALFKQEPTSRQVRTALGQLMARVKAKPKHIITDKGRQFRKQFQNWCNHKKRKIKPRQGAVGKHGSIAVIERLIRTVKDECLRKMLISLNMNQMRQNLTKYIHWYNTHRPHSKLNGATPLEIYENQKPANLKPRYEPRKRRPKTSGCATPVVPIKGKRGVRLELHIRFIDKNRNLPVVELREVA